MLQTLLRVQLKWELLMLKNFLGHFLLYSFKKKERLEDDVLKKFLAQPSGDSRVLQQRDKLGETVFTENDAYMHGITNQTVIL